ncbi:ferritin [bacterium]|nr:ferritin [bacterium]MBU1651385.1 ferritin [bacterium]
MLSKKMEEAFNKQINAEIFSAYLYRSMEAYFKGINLEGFANWMNVQAQEEQFHADKFFNFVYERGGDVNLTAIAAPKTKWDSPMAVFKAVYEHEQHVTMLINGLMDIAEEERDRATISLLHWFIDEQVEEEASADAIVQQLKLGGDKGAALFMIDRELGLRVFTPPTTAV